MLPLIYKAIKGEQALSENFESEGKVYLVRCPKCKKENWAPNVASGVCAWCGYDANRKEEDDRKEKRRDNDHKLVSSRRGRSENSDNAKRPLSNSQSSSEDGPRA